MGSSSGESSEAATRSRILVVDDVAAVRRTIERTLERAGHEVVSLGDAWEAWRRLEAESFDLLLTDLGMPGLGGMDLLEGLRKRDPELPVIILTGAPSTESAMQAVRLAATAYLQKPIPAERLLQEVDRALKLRRLARARRDAQSVSIPPPDEQVPAEWVELGRTFAQALDGLFMVYQPIVSWSRRSVFGYEALARSSAPELAHPMALFDAAERLDALDTLGRRIRGNCAETYRETNTKPALFLNLHPRDLQDDTLYDPNGSLARIALQVVLEITERAKLDECTDLSQRIATLRQLGYRIAIDDIGAGYSGLNSFVALQPDIVKLDMALVRDVHRQPVKQRLVRMLVDLCTDLGIQVVAEGVETVAERDALLGLGCDFLQGYFFARPGAPFPVPSFESAA